MPLEKLSRLGTSLLLLVSLSCCGDHRKSDVKNTPHKDAGVEAMDGTRSPLKGSDAGPGKAEQDSSNADAATGSTSDKDASGEGPAVDSNAVSAPNNASEEGAADSNPNASLPANDEINPPVLVDPFTVEVPASGEMDSALAQAEPGLVGFSCEQDTDCTEGLICLSEDPLMFGKGTIAGGLCTAPCEDDPQICATLSPGAGCLQNGERAYCFAGCTVAAGETIDAGKCAGASVFRMCTEVASASRAALCLPTCFDDRACNEGSHCDQLSGLCREGAPQGAANGQPCVEASECTGGICLDFGQGGLCSAACPYTNFGGGCGYDGGTTFDAVCAPILSENTQYLDPGRCLATCDINAHCLRDGWQCRPFDSEALSFTYGHIGYCVPSDTPAPAIEPIAMGEGAPIGRSCQADDDCAGKFCLKQDTDFFGSGEIAGGFCTARCEDDPGRCNVPSSNASCFLTSTESGNLGYCLETCQVADGGPVDSGKCGNSILRICTSLGSEVESGACLPNCFDDLECDAGKYCNMISGLCSEEEPAGATYGTACSDDQECAGGLCMRDADQNGLCSAFCAYTPLIGGCGLVDQDTGAAALCSPLLTDSQYLDAGVCLATCNADADCSYNNWYCSLFQDSDTEAAVGHLGVCYPGPE